MACSDTGFETYSWTEIAQSSLDDPMMWSVFHDWKSRIFKKWENNYSTEMKYDLMSWTAYYWKYVVIRKTLNQNSLDVIRNTVMRYCPLPWVLNRDCWGDMNQLVSFYNSLCLSVWMSLCLSLILPDKKSWVNSLFSAWACRKCLCWFITGACENLIKGDIIIPECKALAPQRKERKGNNTKQNKKEIETGILLCFQI